MIMKPHPDRLSNAEGRELLAGKAKKKPTAKWQSPKLTESQQQAECVDWFRSKYPDLEELLYAVPNGGKRSKITAAILKREGVISGIPDQCLAVPVAPYHGLYIEQKIKGNSPSDNQKRLIEKLKKQGYKCEVVYSIDEFKEVVTNYLNAA